MGEYSMAEMVWMIFVSTAIITVPGMAMGFYWLHWEKEHASPVGKVDPQEQFRDFQKAA